MREIMRDKPVREIVKNNKPVREVRGKPTRDRPVGDKLNLWKVNEINEIK